MQYRHLGKWGVKVSEVALGSWLTYGTCEAENAATCIHRVYELDINFFDTVNVYAGGETEEVVGQALSSLPRRSYVLSTKVYGTRSPHRQISAGAARPQGQPLRRRGSLCEERRS